MKWPINRGLQRQNFQGKIPHGKHLLKSTSQILGLLVFLVATGVFLSGDVSKFKQKILATVSPLAVSPQGRVEKIDKIAADISVKISDKDFLGSGFIVQRKDNQYIVITNQHVLRAGEAPYRIQTSDGKIHPAEVVNSSVESEYEYDLAVLQFTADRDYATAKIGSSLYLEVGEPIFAVGFPYTELETKASTYTVGREFANHRLSGLAIKTGRIAIILNQALLEGYQIGYTNDVKKGMSGGPLLNSRGEVVGVNGKHAYPLWESPELYQDGSQPCPELEELITRSSLAIPIEKSIKLNPQLESLRPKSDTKVTRKSNLLSENPQLVDRMQAEAEATVQSCENYNYDRNLTDDYYSPE